MRASRGQPHACAQNGGAPERQIWFRALPACRGVVPLDAASRERRSHASRDRESRDESGIEQEVGQVVEPPEAVSDDYETGSGKN
jgi:hypothetical protein